MADIENTIRELDYIVKACNYKSKEGEEDFRSVQLAFASSFFLNSAVRQNKNLVNLVNQQPVFVHPSSILYK